jgi:serine/threonine-protein kinase
VVLTDTSDEEDMVKVLDFGLVKDFTDDRGEDLTQQGLFMGSPKYMAPEQILGNAVSPRTDVYSIGVVAYELLSGKVPFDKGTSVKTMMAHVNEAPTPLADLCPSVSPEMEALVMRCLAKAPESRFEDMDELLRAIALTTGGPLTESMTSGPLVRPAESFEVAVPPPLPSQRSIPEPMAAEASGPRSVSEVVYPSATPAPIEQPQPPTPSRRNLALFGVAAAAVAAIVAVAGGRSQETPNELQPPPSARAALPSATAAASTTAAATATAPSATATATSTPSAVPRATVEPRSFAPPPMPRTTATRKPPPPKATATSMAKKPPEGYKASPY